MTLEEKIGQMTQPDFSALASPEQIKTYARVVHILLCGRPLILGEALDLADATVVAWLPGSEGAGVADVLWGKSVPSGKLPVSWPRSMAQIPINVGDAGYDPLFAYGFGLGY
jgi:beta-glucosidase